MRNFIIVLLLLCAIAVFAVPHVPGTVGIKLIDEISPAPKGSISFSTIPDCYVEASKQIEYEEYGINWLYTIVKLNVFKSFSEVRLFYKLHGTYEEKNLESGGLLLSTGNKADFKLITITPRSKFCIVTLEHVRPTPETLKQIGIGKPVVNITVPVIKEKTIKPVVRRVKRVVHTKKPSVASKPAMKKLPVKSAPAQVVVHPKIIIFDTNPVSGKIINKAPAPKNITPVKKPESSNISGVRKVVPNTTKPKTIDKKEKAYFEG